MQTIKSQSSIKPIEWDVESSPTTVYHNYNVTEKQTDEGIIYEYDTDKMSQQEYSVYITERLNRQDEVIETLTLSSLGAK
jgi:hypothetical protein